MHPHECRGRSCSFMQGEYSLTFFVGVRHIWVGLTLEEEFGITPEQRGMKRVCNTSILVILRFFCAGKFVTPVTPLSALAVCQSLTLSSLAADRQDICLMLLTHTTANLSAPTSTHPHPAPQTPLHTPKWGFGGGAAAKLLCSICPANALRGEGLHEVQRGQNSDGSAPVRLGFTPGCVRGRE